MNFIVPIIILNGFVEKAKIKPEMSDMSLVYVEAMNLFDKPRYKKTLVKFVEVKEINGSFTFIDSYVGQTQKDIDKDWIKS